MQRQFLLYRHLKGHCPDGRCDQLERFLIEDCGLDHSLVWTIDGRNHNPVIEARWRAIHQLGFDWHADLPLVELVVDGHVHSIFKSEYVRSMVERPDEFQRYFGVQPPLPAA